MFGPIRDEFWLVALCDLERGRRVEQDVGVAVFAGEPADAGAGGSQAAVPGRLPTQHGRRHGALPLGQGRLGGGVPVLHVCQPGPQGCNAAPTFGYYAFDGQGSKKDQLTACCDAVLGDYPELGGDDGVRQLIGRLPSV